MKSIRFASFFPSVAAATIATLLHTPVAKADLASVINNLSLQPSYVIPGDTFSFDIYGYNSTTGAGVLLTPKETAIFGATQTFTGAGLDGEDITISSGETGGFSGSNNAGFNITTPGTFISAATYSSLGINTLRFEIGTANSGSNTVDLLAAVTSYNVQSSFQEVSGRIFIIGVPTTTTLSNGNRSLAASVDSFAGANTHAFSYNISYTYAVPEPSVVALLGLGGLALLAGARRLHLRNG